MSPATLTSLPSRTSRLPGCEQIRKLLTHVSAPATPSLGTRGPGGVWPGSSWSSQDPQHLRAGPAYQGGPGPSPVDFLSRKVAV